MYPAEAIYSALLASHSCTFCSRNGKKKKMKSEFAILIWFSLFADQYRMERTSE